MNTEALRKEIYEELRTQYESKLRDAKKQKSQLEEELESSSEKWRSERRRLNAEIDRLENALADNRDNRRKSSDSKLPRSEAQDVAKLQAAADEKLKKATHEWESERAKLQSEVSRLQRGVAELLERANNPMRAGQAAREQVEKKLEEAVKTRQQVEEALLAAKAEWDKEKLKLTGDAIKLRRSLGQGKTVATEEDRTREKDLEKQLAEAQRKRQELEAEVLKTRSEILQARDGQSVEVQRLTAQLNTIRESAAKEYADLTERERRESTLKREAVDGDLKKAHARIQELESTVQKAREETVLAREAQASESQRLVSQLESVRSAVAKEHADQTDRERRENAVSHEALSNELQKAKKEIELLKGAQFADQERQAAQLQETQKAYARIKELERRISETKDSAGKAVDSHVEQERREAAQAREALERDLQKAQREITLLKGTQSADLERQASQLEESQKAHAKIKDLERRLAETKDSAGKESASARQPLEQQLVRIQKEAAEQREKQAQELRQAVARVEESKTEIQQLKRQLEETRDAVSAEVVEQLRRQYDDRLQEMIRQKTELSEQLKNASALLEAERARFGTAAAAQSKAKPAKEAAGPTIAPEVLQAEFTRVESKIAEIARLIDDPSSELSLVIRKNVERAELDAYLKGILFSLGRSAAM